MIKVNLKQIKVLVTIGVSSKERNKKQPLILDLSFNLNEQKSVQSDCIQDTINYSDIVQDVLKLSSQTRFTLLESFTVYIQRKLIKKYSLENLQVTVFKPQATSGLAQVSMQTL